jgi:hypothetical protein
LGADGTWTVGNARERAIEGLRLITIEVTERADCAHFIGWGGSLEGTTLQNFQRTSEWDQFESEFSMLAPMVEVRAKFLEGAKVHPQLCAHSAARGEEWTFTDLSSFPNAVGGVHGPVHPWILGGAQRFCGTFTLRRTRSRKPSNVREMRKVGTSRKMRLQAGGLHPPWCNEKGINGRGEWIRTTGLLVPNLNVVSFGSRGKNSLPNSLIPK